MIAATVAAALANACGSDDHPRPALHRPAAAAWCPSAIFDVHVHKLSDARRGSWDARAVMGLTLDDAIRLAQRHRCQLRPVGGKDVDAHTVLIMDLRFNRINVDVTDGIVTGLEDTSGDMVG
jgi:hypothetical protein